MDTHFRRLIVIGFLFVLSARASIAVPVEVPIGGIVKDCTNNFRANITISELTDDRFRTIDVDGYPITKEANAGNNFCVEFNIGDHVIDRNGRRRPVMDAEQEVERIRSPGEKSILDLEAMIFDVGTNQFVLVSMFATIANQLGFGVELRIPDVFADTNKDGEIGFGDVLYGLVDLTEYVQSIPAFSLGDSVDIINGVVAQFPGMRFSTTPFTFDPNAGFSGTAVTAPGRIDAEHRLTALPEPGSVLLVLSGWLLVFLMLPRRRQPAATSTATTPR
jgi:hypothetical protein